MNFGRPILKFRTRFDVYDLENDLSERENIRWQSPEKTQQLIEAWEKWNKPMKDRVFPTLGADNWWKNDL